MPRADWSEDDCPIARSLSVLGERWAMLIVREAMQGCTRFTDFRDHLGIAPDILSARLSALVAMGVFEAVDYREPGDRRRQQYELTAAGRELSTVLASLAHWGRAHLPMERDNGYRFVDSVTGQPVRAGLRRGDGRPADPAKVILARRTE
ncbi:winged helix-turn-helix transcriptional regulator [Mycobacterium sp. WMMD1722]|uniref:winged helix-turn-helix transcriptional regulator n=1 Tax=Mycobacterium sp. WMMD1722 TaxID=3404117 RepID=UPI003BF56E03